MTDARTTHPSRIPTVQTAASADEVAAALAAVAGVGHGDERLTTDHDTGYERWRATRVGTRRRHFGREQQ